jgi:hypothetical protein
LPTWALGVISFLVFAGLGGGVYWYLQRGSAPAEEKPAAEAMAAKPAEGAAAGGPVNKSIEVVGLRMITNKNPAVKFVVVNHSGSEVSGISGDVKLWLGNSRAAKDAVGSFSFSIKSLAGNASQELTQPLETNMKAYELPDWQLLTAQVQVTSDR